MKVLKIRNSRKDLNIEIHLKIEIMTMGIEIEEKEVWIKKKVRFFLKRWILKDKIIGKKYL